MVRQLVSVGESTGALDSMPIKIADYFDSEVEMAVEHTRLLMLTIIGMVVCGVVAAMAAAVCLKAMGM